MERRLAAILAADVVGFSRLMGEDEAGTLERLKSLHKQLVQPKIAQRKGRIVKLMGDGLLAEFPSVVEAVQCAADIQTSMIKRESELPDERQIRLRIGVNLGDIIVEGTDIYGDGVNVAARLEALAEPGGVCLSGTVFDHVKGKVGLNFADLGEMQVKNIDQLLRVYRIELDGTTEASRVVGKSATGATEPTLAEKHSVAVLPFTNMTDDPEQEYFSDGITEDIITELSRFAILHVVARHSSFAFKREVLDIKEVGRKLGVQYVVEGSVRRAGNRMRVTAQLVEAKSGNHVWAERYDRDLEDLFAVQDDVVRTIVSTVSGRIDVAGKLRADRMSDASLRAYDLYLRAKAAQDRNTKENYRLAEKYLEQAIGLDTGFAQARHQLSLVKFWNWMVNWADDPQKTFDESFDAAKKAVALDDTDSMAHAHLGMLHIYRREFEEAGLQLEKAIRLNPNDASVLGINGFYLTAIGAPDRAIEMYDQAARLNPLQPSWITRSKGIACLTAGRYDEAISNLKSIEAPINMIRWWLAASYAHAGRLGEARATLDEFLRVAEKEMPEFPGRSLNAWMTFSHAIEYKNQADTDHLFDGLRKAGLQE